MTQFPALGVLHRGGTVGWRGQPGRQGGWNAADPGAFSLGCPLHRTVPRGAWPLRCIMSDRDRIQAVEAAIRAVLRDPANHREIACLASELAYWQVQAMAALMRRRRRASPNGYVSAEVAQQITSISKRWFYEHAAELPFARKKGGRVVFDKAGLLRWMAER